MPVDPDSRLGRSVQSMAGSSWFAKVGPKVMPSLDRFTHRVTRGRVMVSRAMLPVLVLTTTGRKSGEPRVSPLATVPFEGDFYVVGSNFGRPNHPAWSWNLLEHPDARISYQGKELPVRAELLSPQDKAATWPRLTEMWPLFDLYTQRSGRDLRVFRLSPV